MENLKDNSRRMFLTQSLSALGMLIFPWDLLKTENFSDINLLDKGFLFSKEDLPRIRKNTQLPLFKEYWQSMVNADLKADTKFLKEELNIRRHFRDIIKAGDILKRSSLISFVGDNKEHEDIARLAIEKIHSFEDWDYFTEGGKEIIAFQCAPDAITSFILALDWMGHKLSIAEKEDMLKAIAKKGAEPCYLTLYGMKHPDKVKGWAIDPREDYKNKVDLSKWPVILNKTNLKIVPVAGLMMAAIALKGKNPDSKKWLDLGITSMKDFAPMWGKDGAYSEGFSYSGYSTKHMILCSEILKRAMNVKYDDLVNYKSYARFILQMTTPFKDNPFGCLSFGDNAFSIENALFLWIASKFKDGLAQYTGEKYQSRVNSFSVVWYDDSVKIKEPTPDLMDVKFSNDWVVTRSGWSAEDTVVGFKSGGPANHEHADRNSITLNAYGERLLHDPLGAAYQYTDKHWILRHTDSHTAVLVDGKPHQYHDGRDGTNASDAVAKVTQFKPGKKLTICSSDATPAYKLVNSDIKKVQRTIALLKPDIFIIIDELQTIKNESKLQSRFQAYNVDGKALLKFQNESNSFQIIRPTARLFAKIYSNVKSDINDGKIDVPEEKGNFPFIEVSNEKSKNCLMITACVLIPEIQKDEPEIIINTENKSYNLKIRHKSKEYNLQVQIGKEFPNVKLLS